MGVIEGKTWTEILSPDRCWELLAGRTVGRLAVIVEGIPEIYPVNYTLDGESIVFRTGAGNKLTGITASPQVAFEVDRVDEDERVGWSVLVKGRATEITDPAELRVARDRDLDLWIPAERPVWIRVAPLQVTGRRTWSRSESASETGEPSPEPPLD